MSVIRVSKSKTPLNARRITNCVVREFFSPRYWAVCPNVSWGMLPYEADLLCISKHHCIHEVEIKTSPADLRIDQLKRKWRSEFHNPRRYVDVYWLAVPHELSIEALERADKIGAGVIEVRDGRAYKLMEPKKKVWKKFDFFVKDRISARIQLWRLLSMRFWKQRFDEEKYNDHARDQV